MNVQPVANYIFAVLVTLLSIYPGISVGRSDAAEPPKAHPGQWHERMVIRSGELDQQNEAALQVAQNAADECSRALEKAIDTGIKTEKEVFSTLYFPRTPLTSPLTFTTFYDDYTDIVIPPIEDGYLSQNPNLLYVVLLDRNGYVPSHNSIYAQPPTGDPVTDYHYCRSKRIFNDMVGYTSSRNTSPFLIQIYNRDTGEKLVDISVPVRVKGKHWGALRVGYLTGE